jgi:glycerol-3-phosphate dehydrogenase
MAEDVIDHGERVGGLPHRPCVTAELPVHAAGDAGAVPVPLQGYGTDAARIVELGATEGGLDAPVHPALPLCPAEVLWHVRHEMARTVDDVLARRTRALVLDARASIAAAPAVARLLARELRRDEAWVAGQVEAYREIAQGWLLDGSTGSGPAPSDAMVA